MVDEILAWLLCSRQRAWNTAMLKALFPMALDDNAPPHPGELIRDDIFPELGITKTEFARRLGISLHRLNNLLAERQPVSLDLAMRLGAVVGYGPRYWLGVQLQFDIWRAEQERPVDLKPIVWRRAKVRINGGSMTPASHSSAAAPL